MLVTIVPIFGVFYQAAVVLPEFRAERIASEAARKQDEEHAKKMESLRKRQITESALLWVELQDLRKTVKATMKGE